MRRIGSGRRKEDEVRVASSRKREKERHRQAYRTEQKMRCIADQITETSPELHGRESEEYEYYSGVRHVFRIYWYTYIRERRLASRAASMEMTWTPCRCIYKHARLLGSACEACMRVELRYPWCVKQKVWPHGDVPHCH